MKSKFSPLVLAFAIFSGTAAVQARQADGGSGSDVVVELHKLGDKVDLHVTSKMPLRHLSMRWIQNPHRLRLTIPGGHLASPSGRVAIDKGVLQWAEAQSNGEGVIIEVATISSPKCKVTAGADGRSLDWSASATDIAAGEALPSLPQALTDGGSGFPSLAVAERPKKNVVAPKAIVKPKEDKEKPAPKIASIPKEATPVKPTAPLTVKPADKLISLTANGELRGALTALAASAGLKAEIDPGVQGSVTMSFQDVPLNKAVSQILGQQAELYRYTISDTTLKVTASSGGGGQTMIPVAPSGKFASDYFPIRDKKAIDVLDEVRKAVPGLTYLVDDRLNQIVAEGDPAELERLRKLLHSVSNK